MTQTLTCVCNVWHRHWHWHVCVMASYGLRNRDTQDFLACVMSDADGAILGQCFYCHVKRIINITCPKWNQWHYIRYMLTDIKVELGTPLGLLTKALSFLHLILSLIVQNCAINAALIWEILRKLKPYGNCVYLLSHMPSCYWWRAHYVKLIS